MRVSLKMASCDIISDISDITTFSEPPKPLISWSNHRFKIDTEISEIEL